MPQPKPRVFERKPPPFYRPEDSQYPQNVLERASSDLLCNSGPYTVTKGWHHLSVDHLPPQDAAVVAQTDSCSSKCRGHSPVPLQTEGTALIRGRASKVRKFHCLEIDSPFASSKPLLRPDYAVEKACLPRIVWLRLYLLSLCRLQPANQRLPARPTIRVGLFRVRVHDPRSSTLALSCPILHHRPVTQRATSYGSRLTNIDCPQSSKLWKPPHCTSLARNSSAVWFDFS